MDTPKKILIISIWESQWSLGEGAGVSDDHHFIDKMTTAGYELHFLAPRGRPTDDKRVHVHTYPNFLRATTGWPKWARRLTWPLLFAFVVTPHAVATARRVRPDVVLGHSHHSALPAYFVRELFRVPSAVKLFGVMDLVHAEWPPVKYFAKNFEQIAALKVPQDAWIILDDGTQGGEAATRHGVAAEKIHFIPNGIDLQWADESCDGAAMREELGLPADAVVVLFLARLVLSKRPEALIEAAPDIVKRVDGDIHFVFAGDGDIREACERLADTRGVGERTHFIGALAHERVPHLMAASDIFVSTSNLTNAAIPTCEAMVCGLPTVAYDIGNTSDIVRDTATGLLVADGDVGALAEAVASLALDTDRRRNMGEAARAMAREKFTSWDDRIAMERRIFDALVTA